MNPSRPEPLPALLLAAWFALGFALASWVHVFFGPNNPYVTPQARADRLAAANYLAREFTAPLPPGGTHWAQRHTRLNLDAQTRHAVAREGSALWMALWGAKPSLAGSAAFGLAFAALSLCAGGSARPQNLPIFLVPTLALTLTLAVARTHDWRMDDPTPYLVTAAAAAVFGGWRRLKAETTAWPRTAAWSLAAGLALLLLISWELAATAATLSALSLKPWRTDAPNTRAILVPVAILLGVTLAFFAIRNLATEGQVLKSPAAVYQSANVTAPRWFWQKIGFPPKSTDPLLERYDELVAIAETRWQTPVYQTWLNQIRDHLLLPSGCVLLALAALQTILRWETMEARAFAWTVGVFSALALLRYAMPTYEWLVLTPLVLNLSLGALAWIREKNASGWRFAGWIMALALTHLATLHWAPKARPAASETGHHARASEILKTLSDKPGPHLIIVEMTATSDPRVEPADLPRDWQKADKLFARDLGTEKNQRLVESFPGYTAWRMIVHSNRVGLQPWRKPETETEAPASSALDNTKPEPSSRDNEGQSEPPTQRPANTTGAF